MSKEAMKLALEALEICAVRQEHLWHGLQKLSMAKNALQAALAKPDFWEGYVPEPVKPAQQEPEHTVSSNRRYSPLLTHMMNKRVKSNLKQVIELYDSPEQPAPVASPHEQEPVACKTLCELCAKRGYSGCANAAQITPIPSPPAQQEPVEVKQIAEALRQVGLTLVRTGGSFRVMDLGRIEAQATSPPAQRTWVGLTNEQKLEAVKKFRDAPVALVFDIEAKLKEKNT